MSRSTVAEAQTHLSDLLDAVSNGEFVEIVRGTERFRLVSLPPPRPRPPVTGVPKAGSLEGELVVPEDFKEPLVEFTGVPE